VKTLAMAGLALACLLVNCGGGGSTTPAAQTAPGLPQGEPVPVDGIWTGTLRSNALNQDLPGKAVILPNGQFNFATDDQSVMIFGNAKVSGDAVSLNESLLMQRKPIILGGINAGIQIASTSITLQGGTVVEETSLNSAFTAGFLGSDYATGSLALTWSPVLNVPVQLTNLVGTYTGNYQSASPIAPAPMTLAVAADGTVTDPTGAYKATLTQVGTGVNAFKVALVKVSSGTQTDGVAFYVPAVGATATSNAQPAMLWIQTPNGRAQLSLAVLN